MNPFDQARAKRAEEPTIVDGVPDLPGILAAMALSSSLETHLRGVAHTLLFEPFPGSTLSRAERELIATAVSVGNDCYFCATSHLAFACATSVEEGGDHFTVLELGNGIVTRQAIESGGRMPELLAIAEAVRLDPTTLTREEIEEAKAAGASDGDIQVTILIAAAFSMFNRMVDGLRAKTPADAVFYTARADAIAERGYLPIA